MNIDIYCKSVYTTTDYNNEVKVLLVEVDRMSLLEEITDKFTLLEIAKLYELDFVKETCGQLQH